MHIGLTDIYRRAGFVVGAPGCSYCLGVAADVASSGTVWLSSQNRNFRNRCVFDHCPIIETPPPLHP